MTIASFTLPIDIPWKRIAISEDMIDPVACDRELPPRWMSSVAVFAYEPPEDQQRTDDFRVSYLKVSCSITGFQSGDPRLSPRDREINIRKWLGRSKWTNADLKERLGEAAAAYYPCNGAILEVVVAPHPDDKRFTLAEYPYFSDFDPKKRELYEVVTETGETMSRSLEDVAVRLGQTTLQSHEVRDSTTLAGELAGAYGNAQTGGQLSAKGSASNTSGTTDLSQQGTENIRTTDGAREARETFSHTTQLSQLYHQLDSYHLGTNRAAFFVLPRPHVVQSPSTFVNGPREIEGVQEFMLVVVRPKEMETFCVEAYLETAHLTGKPIYDWDSTEILLNLPVSSPDNTIRTSSAITPLRTGYVVDKSRIPFLAPDAMPHGPPGGYEVVSAAENNIPRQENSVTSDYTFVVGSEQVELHGWVEGWPGRGDRPTTGGTLDVMAKVFLKKKVPTVASYAPGLLITGRAVCSCNRDIVAKPDFNGLSVVYENALPKSTTESPGKGKAMSIREANQLGADLKREMLQSLSSPDRYPRGMVGLFDSQLLSDMMGTHIRHANEEVNPRLLDWPGVNQALARRVTGYDSSITRSQMLEMPLAQQVEQFALTFAEAVELRRELTEVANADGPLPIPERVRVEVPLLMGLQSYEAQAAVVAAGLNLNASEVVDSPMPSNTVIAQEPEPRYLVDPATKVSVKLASGCSVRLPELTGLRFSEAACLLRNAGLRSEPSIEGRPGPEAHVTALKPKAGTLVTPNMQVTITLGRQTKVRVKPNARTR